MKFSKRAPIPRNQCVRACSSAIFWSYRYVTTSANISTSDPTPTVVHCARRDLSLRRRRTESMPNLIHNHVARIDRPGCETRVPLVEELQALTHNALRCVTMSCSACFRRRSRFQHLMKDPEVKRLESYVLANRTSLMIASCRSLRTAVSVMFHLATFHECMAVVCQGTMPHAVRSKLSYFDTSCLEEVSKMFAHNYLRCPAELLALGVDGDCDASWSHELSNRSVLELFFAVAHPILQGELTTQQRLCLLRLVVNTCLVDGSGQAVIRDIVKSSGEIIVMLSGESMRWLSTDLQGKADRDAVALYSSKFVGNLLRLPLPVKIFNRCYTMFNSRIQHIGAGWRRNVGLGLVASCCHSSPSLTPLLKSFLVGRMLTIVELRSAMTDALSALPIGSQAHSHVALTLRHWFDNDSLLPLAGEGEDIDSSMGVHLMCNTGRKLLHQLASPSEKTIPATQAIEAVIRWNYALVATVRSDRARSVPSSIIVQLLNVVISQLGRIVPFLNREQAHGHGDRSDDNSTHQFEASRAGWLASLITVVRCLSACEHLDLNHVTFEYGGAFVKAVCCFLRASNYVMCNELSTLVSLVVVRDHYGFYAITLAPLVRMLLKCKKPHVDAASQFMQHFFCDWTASTHMSRSARQWTSFSYKCWVVNRAHSTCSHNPIPGSLFAQLKVFLNTTSALLEICDLVKRSPSLKANVDLSRKSSEWFEVMLAEMVRWMRAWEVQPAAAADAGEMFPIAAVEEVMRLVPLKMIQCALLCNSNVGFWAFWKRVTGRLCAVTIHFALAHHQLAAVRWTLAVAVVCGRVDLVHGRSRSKSDVVSPYHSNLRVSVGSKELKECCAVLCVRGTKRHYAEKKRWMRIMTIASPFFCKRRRAEVERNKYRLV